MNAISGDRQLQSQNQNIGKSALIDGMAEVAEVFFTKTGMARTRVSREIFDRGGQLDDLTSGRRDLSTATFERAMQWFSDNWPEGANWPNLIWRPHPSKINTGVPQVGSFQ